MRKDAAKPEPAQLSAYPIHTPIQTRWMDNDVYGHVNNVTYYSYFDTAVNGYLIAQGALDIENSPVIGLVVETSCRYRAPITFPDAVTAGIRVGGWGHPRFVMKSACFAKASKTPPRRAISSMFMWTAPPAAPCRCQMR